MAGEHERYLDLLGLPWDKWGCRKRAIGKVMDQFNVTWEQAKRVVDRYRKARGV